MTHTPMYSPERLRSLFQPRSIVLVGASEKSTWSWNFHNILHDGHFTGPVYYVNPRGGTVHGLPAFSRLSDIGEPIDLALIVVPPPAVLSVLQEMDEVGIRNAVLITAGFGEMGAEGQQMQQELIDYAHAHDIAFLGPNCLGYINVAHNVPAMPSPFPPVIEGHVAVIAQSGALTSTLFNYAYMQHIGINALASTGNEAVLSISELMDYFVEDEATKVIALFVEAIRNPEQFISAAQRALENGKPIVAFKIGRSERGAEVAQAHTGALVGDDRVIDALFRQLGLSVSTPSRSCLSLLARWRKQEYYRAIGLALWLSQAVRVIVRQIMLSSTGLRCRNSVRRPNKDCAPCSLPLARRIIPLTRPERWSTTSCYLSGSWLRSDPIPISMCWCVPIHFLRSPRANLSTHSA